MRASCEGEHARSTRFALRAERTHHVDTTEAFGDALADQAAGNRPDCGTERRADRTDHGSGTRADGRSVDNVTHAGAEWMCARNAGE
jgi:hypothetical protein